MNGEWWSGRLVEGVVGRRLGDQAAKAVISKPSYRHEGLPQLRNYRNYQLTNRDIEIIIEKMMKKWTVHDRYGNEIYLTEERWHHANNFVITGWAKYIIPKR